ncbi:ArsR/SmtB family transcription factor [Pleomorphomonas carboxyditropha]|uniref:ArsR family transcriptional regulator n=1 Tax=Pleomorphomonas carboxyditropha TaxID=2023338 RepID=A0A2G9WZC0_9HYPH|nr:helix-turn-helix domain-containing protein [Pleomorphomonas carboxyditropha]PIP00020.1 ArsR family transcriptional regulator [Pleomorphomonas carboxyditropha]
MNRNFLTLHVADSYAMLKGVSSPTRLDILRLLHAKGPMNVNEISAALSLPQSTVATSVQALEEAELIDTKTVKAKKGHQKICSARYDEIIIRFDDAAELPRDETIEVSMPIGLYTSCDVQTPCGLCSSEGVIGLLDVPNFFLDPNRMQAGLLWFGRGYVEYKFPNNAKILNEEISAVEFSMELSSEVPGTNTNWPSDIMLWVNNVDVGTWTSPGDYGDKRGVYTPRWWKLEGSQYGKLKTWTISQNGTFIDGIKISDVKLADLDIDNHHSIRMRIGIAEQAKRPGGINIFGRGFGNYDQDIVMRLYRSNNS